MSKKVHKKNHQFPLQGPAAAARPVAAAQQAIIGEKGGKKGAALWVTAALLIVSGYFTLHKADPSGQNWWAVLSPALLLSGYLLIIPAISRTYRG